MNANRSDKVQTMRIGAQVITWGDQVRPRLPHILAHLRSCGYRGVEIGMRHFDLERSGEYLELLKRHDMTLVAAHSGGTFWNREQADAEMNTIGKAIRFAASLNAPFFALSGNDRETPETMKVTAESYNRIGRLCRDAGLQLAYHNHDWEFSGDGALFTALLEQTDPALVRLLPDVAWIHRAGLVPSDFLKKHGNRLAYVHLKDTLPDRFCELGRGDVDLDGILACLPELDVEWCVAEQDSTDSTPENSLSMSAACLRKKGLLQ